MRIKITENQLKRLNKVINEANTPIDNLNNLINAKDITITTGLVVVTFDSIMVEGDIKDGNMTVKCLIDKIKYDGKDVTDFALAWTLRNEWTSDDLPLGTIICTDLSEIMNKEFLSLIGVEISEYDVIIE